jgi:hypothetical protein
MGMTSGRNGRLEGFARLATAESQVRHADARDISIRRPIRLSAALVIIAAVAATACGRPGGNPDGQLASEDLLSCGGGNPFPEDSLKSRAGIENDDSEMGRAVRRAIEGMAGDGESWRRFEGYRILDSSPSRVLLGAGDPISLYLVLEREKGAWHAAGWGGCGLRRYREGFSEAEWELDPSFPAPSREDSVVHVLANDRQCASGRSPEERMLAPEVEVEETVFVITFWARPVEVVPPNTGVSCQGHSPVARTVDLGEPRGARGLADGGPFPPRVMLADEP